MRSCILRNSRYFVVGSEVADAEVEAVLAAAAVVEVVVAAVEVEEATSP